MISNLYLYIFVRGKVFIVTLFVCYPRKRCVFALVEEIWELSFRVCIRIDWLDCIKFICFTAGKFDGKERGNGYNLKFWEMRNVEENNTCKWLEKLNFVISIRPICVVFFFFETKKDELLRSMNSSLKLKAFIPIFNWGSWAWFWLISLLPAVLQSPWMKGRANHLVGKQCLLFWLP